MRKNKRLKLLVFATVIICCFLFFLSRNDILRFAVERGSPTLTKIMLSLGADPNIMDEGAFLLYWAAGDGDEAEVQTLIQGGADINLGGEQGDTPLMSAVEENKTKVVKLLISKGATKRLQNRKGRTALDIAIASKNKELIAMLKN